MKISKQYIAGLFDGEGSVSIIKSNADCYLDKNGIKKNTIRYRLTAAICMTDNKVLDYLREKYGGTGHLRKGVNTELKFWKVGNIQAITFLKDIQKYSIIKQEQIKLAIQFREFKSTLLQGKFVDKDGNRRRYSQETYQRFNRFYSNMHIINSYKVPYLAV